MEKDTVGKRPQVSKAYIFDLELPPFGTSSLPCTGSRSVCVLPPNKCELRVSESKTHRACWGIDLVDDQANSVEANIILLLKLKS